MKRAIIRLAAFLFLGTASISFAQVTAFTYQGRLNDGASPASGVYDLRFAIYGAGSGGSALAGPATNSLTSISNGLFTVTLDFGAGVFNGANRWLEIAARTNGSGAFVTLSPRQQLTSTPYAIHSANALNASVAATASSVSAANVSGVLALAQLPPTVVTNGASGVNFAGTFTGNGFGMTNVPLSALVQPQVPLILWGSTNYGLTTIPPDVGTIAAISIGGAHALVLRSNGTVTAWGRGMTNANNGTDLGQAIVPLGLNNVVAVSAGLLNSLALKSDGTVVAWGAGMTNDLGNGIESGQSIVPAGLSNVVAISAGSLHSVALKNNGTVVVWGNGQAGQTNIPSGLNNVISASAGYVHTVALKSDGTVVAWGGGMTNNPNSSYDFGQSIVPAGLNNVVAISTKFLHSLALRSDGTVVAWGAGTTNDPSGTSYHYGQSIVPAGLSNVVAISAGYLHNLALKSDGTIVGWGAGMTNDPDGRPFDGGQSIAPSVIGQVTVIEAGLLHSAALTSAQWIPAQLPTLTGSNFFQGPITAASFAGDGSGLTALSASELTGTISDSRLSGNVALLNSNQTFTASLGLSGQNTLEFGVGVADKEPNAGKLGYQVFSDALDIVGAGTNGTDLKIKFWAEGGSTFTGPVSATSFIGNGSGLTNLDASKLTGSIADARLSANVSLLGPSIESSEISDGTIVNADINAAAGIADTKLATISTAGKVANSALSSSVSLLGQTIESSEITDGTIGNADINAAAGIADTKLGTIATAGKVADSALSANVALRSGGNTFTGDQVVTNGALYSYGGTVVRPANPGWAAVAAYDGTNNTTGFRAFVGADGVGLTGTANQMYVGTYTTHPVKFFMGNAERMVINTNGNVGIASSSPGKMLQLGGALNTEAMIRLNSTAADGVAGRAWDIGVAKSDTSTAGKFFSFSIQDTAATLPALVVRWDTGNVGLYNTNPANLFVVGNAASPAYCNGTSWVNGSDRNAKEHFATIDPVDVLARVVALPVQSWSYKAQPGEKHIGPMAQDFHDAFGLNGDDNKHIATVDESGVALAAIQGLNQKLEAARAENVELKSRLEKLEQLLNAQIK